MPDKRGYLKELWPMMQEHLAAGEAVQFTINGTSMRPMLYWGRDQVILGPVPEKLKKYDLPLYRRDNGQFVLHRIVEVGETITCVGDNQIALETGLRQDQMLAVAVGFIRNGKKYSVNHRAYRLYCRFWHYTRPIRRIYHWFKYGIKRRLDILHQQKNK